MRGCLPFIFFVACAAVLAVEKDVKPLTELPAGALAFSSPPKDGVEKFALSPDGTRLAAVGAGGHLLLYDAASAKLLKDYETGGPCAAIDFCADGKEVITAGPGSVVRVWNLESGKSTRKFEGHATDVRAVACSPDGSRVASTDSSGALRIWDAGDGKSLFNLTSKKYPDDPPAESITTEGLAFSPDGRFIISEANDVKARVWDAAHGVELRMVPDHDGTTAAVSVSPGGILAATTRSGGIMRIWKIESGEIVRTISGYEDDPTCSVFAPDDTTLFAAARDETIRQWDVESGLELRRWKVTADPTALACSADGKRLYSLSPDAGVVIWDLAAPPITSGKFADSMKSFDAAWMALGSTDYDARSEAVLYYLKHADQAGAIKHLVEKLNVAGADEAARKMQRELIAKLDSAAYEERLEAANALKKLGHAARETLTEALQNPSSEVRNRVSELLRDLGGAVDGRAFLALEIFGIMHSPGAKEALSALAGKEGARGVRAKAILRRWREK